MAQCTVEMLEIIISLPENMQEDIKSFMEENSRECIYTRTDVINAWLTWNGIIGYTDQIISLVQTLMEEPSNG